MPKLVIVRHGQSQWNLENRFTGWIDIDLSPAGEAEALKAGNKLKEYKFDEAFTSDLKRASRTLDIILKEIDQTDIPVQHDKALNERMYGDLQGLNKDECRKKFGEEQVKIWRRSYDVRPPFLEIEDDRNPGKLVQYRDVPKEKLPLAESLKDTAERVNFYFDSAIAVQLKKEKNV